MENLKEYLKENATTDELKEMSRSVIQYNGGLDWLEYWENDEDFFNTMYGNNINEAIRAVCYGEYKYMDTYVRINVYGNLESVSEWEYEKEIEESKEEIIDAWLEVYEEDKDYLAYDDIVKKINEFLGEAE